MRQSSKTISKGDPDVMYNLQKVDQNHKKEPVKESGEAQTNQAGEDWIQRVENLRAHSLDTHHAEEKRRNGGLAKNVGAILTVILIIFITLSYYSYVVHWFADIFTGKCSWWSLGFLCTSG